MTDIRRRGVKPFCQEMLMQRVSGAVRRLEQSAEKFTVNDIARLSGVSRATIYRYRELRDIIGYRGDGKVTKLTP